MTSLTLGEPLCSRTLLQASQVEVVLMKVWGVRQIEEKASKDDELVMSKRLREDVGNVLLRWYVDHDGFSSLDALAHERVPSSNVFGLVA